MSEAIEIRTIIGNRNINTVTDTPITDPAAVSKVKLIKQLTIN